MDAPSSVIGQRLKAIRTSKGLSLEETAKRTGVSKPMLGQIERGRSIPTVTTLWKIATGLKTPLSAFLEEPQPEYAVVARNQPEAIFEEDGQMRAYPMFGYDPIRNVEIFYIEFDGGCRHESEQHDAGVEEYLFVLTGTLHLALLKQELTLEQGQAIRFRADVPHVYQNPGQTLCSVYNIIFYPNRGGNTVCMN